MGNLAGAWGCVEKFEQSLGLVGRVVGRRGWARRQRSDQDRPLLPGNRGQAGGVCGRGEGGAYSALNIKIGYV